MALKQLGLMDHDGDAGDEGGFEDGFSSEQAEFLMEGSDGFAVW